MTTTSTNPLEVDIAREFMICPDCGKDVHTRPAEKVPAQQLRACNECDAVFNMDMSAMPRYTPLPEEETDPRDARIAELEAALRELVVRVQLMPQPATHDGLQLADSLAAARRALNPSIELNLSDKEK